MTTSRRVPRGTWGTRLDIDNAVADTRTPKTVSEVSENTLRLRNSCAAEVDDSNQSLVGGSVREYTGLRPFSNGRERAYVRREFWKTRLVHTSVCMCRDGGGGCSFERPTRLIRADAPLGVRCGGQYMAQRCIYTQPSGLCSGAAPLHPKEHCLPAGLGEFKGDIKLAHVICWECQERFGRLEDVFLHNSPEAFLRVLLGQRGRKRKKGKNIFYEPTAGLNPMPVLGQPDDMPFPLLWEPVTASESRAMKQIVFKDRANGTFYHLPYRPGFLTEAKVDKFLAANGVADPKLEGFFFDEKCPEEEEEICSACRRFLTGTLKSGELREGLRVEAQAQIQISPMYLRVIAKTAFHFVLARFPFDGFECEFDGIKRFIYHGGDPSPFVKCLSEPVIAELRDASVRALQWQHVLSAQCDQDHLEARMQFYIGPAITPHTWVITFGRTPSRLNASYGRGFAYRYYEGNHRDAEGYVGAVIELQRG